MIMDAGITPATLSALIALVRKHTGIAMTERKSVLLERRLRPRVQALKLNSYQAYLDMVEQDRAEIPHFIDLVTTNDTLFFRTPQCGITWNRSSCRSGGASIRASASSVVCSSLQR
jgi:chemotaxis protein methyltransferase CheR